MHSPKYALANQRPSLPLTAPAITRHVLLRIPNQINPRWLRHNTTRPRRWFILLTRINRVIDNCYQSFNPRIADDQRSKFWIKENGERSGDNCHLASDSFFADLDPGNSNYRVRLRIDINLETVAFTLAIDRIASQDIIKELAGIAEPTDQLLQRIFDHSFGISIPVLDDCFSHAFEDAEGTQVPASIRYGEPSDAGAIADIHGFVLPAAVKTEFVAPGREAYEAAVTTTALSEGVKGFLQQNPDFIRHFVADAWHANEVTGTPTGLLGTEAVVCGMLNGRALYASPLSVTPRRDARINFLVVYDGNSQAQLGRFVRRLHVMAELRLSALIDFSVDRPKAPPPRDLVEASQEIRRIGAELTNIEQGKSERDVTFKAAKAHFYLLNDCSPDGIVFRVERSRYYSDAFKTRLQDLRIVRLEGWQPYDEFVRRYLFQVFDMIASIGTRYESLGRRIDRLQSFDVGNNIVDQTTAATKLQHRAEDIAVLAGIYYFYSLLCKTEQLYDGWHEIGQWFYTSLAILALIDTFLGHRPRNATFAWIKRMRGGKGETDTQPLVITAPTTAIRSTDASA